MDFGEHDVSKRLSEQDKQWLKDNPDFHLVGTTSVGNRRSANSNGSHTRASNENDQHIYEMHRTLSRRLQEYEIYESMSEDC